MADRGDNRRFSYGDSRSLHGPTDDPPNSRLFVIGNKKLNEQDFRDAFSTFGEIEDIWVVKDRRTGENKGVTYIKYGKTSDAANAMETMNGKVLANTERHIKVMIASSRDKGSQREENEDEKIQRLFVIVPKTMVDSELNDYFKQFGDVDYVNIVKDKETRESKGFAYVKYLKFSHAARAFEECDRKYKAVFSEPRKPNMNRMKNNNFENNDYNNDRSDRMDHRNSMNNMNYSYNEPQAFEKNMRLVVIGSPHLTEDQLWKLFNIIPGLEFVQLRMEPHKRRTLSIVIFSNMKWGTYACEKLHGFEYPTGSRLIVKPENDMNGPPMEKMQQGFDYNPAQQRLKRDGPPNSLDNPDLRQLAESIAQATSIIQNAGLSQEMLHQSRSSQHGGGSLGDMCNVSLPGTKPLANIDAETVARCFIVCTPPAPSPAVLRDVFCRFGNLIEVYMLAHRNCGYAKYSSKESADEAIKTLHGAELCGGRMKVMEAEERGDHSRKRLRMDDQ